jgi:hypothetical protein
MEGRTSNGLHDLETRLTGEIAAETVQPPVTREPGKGR